MQKVAGFAIGVVKTAQYSTGCFSGQVQESREDQSPGFGAVSFKGYN